MIEIKTASMINLDCLQLLFEQYRQFYHMKPSIKLSKQFISERLSKKDSLIFLAFENQEPVAFVQLYPSFSSVAMKPIWILNDLFVTEKSRKKGVARHLMLAVEKQAKEKKIFSIKLATGNENQKAQALYRSLEYQLNDTFDFYSKRIE
jgi:ribosomal protein S18 acetylase RimI-like enzyme